MPISYSRCACGLISSIISLQNFYKTTKVIGKKINPGILQIKKKKDHKNKIMSLSLHFLEGVWSFLQSLMLIIVTFWDVHLHNM